MSSCVLVFAILHGLRRLAQVVGHFFQCWPVPAVSTFQAVFPALGSIPIACRALLGNLTLKILLHLSLSLRRVAELLFEFGHLPGQLLLGRLGRKLLPFSSLSRGLLEFLQSFLQVALAQRVGQLVGRTIFELLGPR